MSDETKAILNEAHDHVNSLIQEYTKVKTLQPDQLMAQQGLSWLIILDRFKMTLEEARRAHSANATLSPELNSMLYIFLLGMAIQREIYWDPFENEEEA